MLKVSQRLILSVGVVSILQYTIADVLLPGNIQISYAGEMLKSREDNKKQAFENKCITMIKHTGKKTISDEFNYIVVLTIQPLSTNKKIENFTDKPDLQENIIFGISDVKASDLKNGIWFEKSSDLQIISKDGTYKVFIDYKIPEEVSTIVESGEFLLSVVIAQQVEDTAKATGTIIRTNHKDAMTYLRKQVKLTGHLVDYEMFRFSVKKNQFWS